jgi:hypothetical protein
VVVLVYIPTSSVRGFLFPHIGWLILCVNFTGLSGVQITGKTIILGVSARMFLEQISISISICFHQYAWTSSDPQRVWREEKGRGGADLLSS